MDTLISIKKWIEAHAPIVLEQLEPPASSKEIEVEESAIGLKLPSEYKKLLQMHNGEQGSFETLLGDGNALLSCAGILETYNYERENCEISHTDLLQKQEWKDLVLEELMSVKGAVHPHESHEKWIPITNMNGDVIRYIDFDPAPTGMPGQIVEVDYQSQCWCVLAPSFEALLKQYLHDLVNGIYKVQDDGYITKIEHDIEEPACEILSWLQGVDDTREIEYKFNEKDWHLDLRNEPIMRGFLNKTYPMELEIFAWQDYKPSKIDKNYYEISWVGNPAGLFIAFANKSIFEEIAIKIKKKSQKLTSVRLRVNLLKMEEPGDRKSHPRMRCWLEATDVVLLE